MSIARFNVGIIGARRLPEGFTESSRFGLNDGYRAFQCNRGTCGGRACVDKHDQALDLSHRPLSAANPHHVAQSGVSGLVPK
jgi:hypothetical protein